MEIARTAPGALTILWKEKFFMKGKSMAETKKALEEKGYNFTNPNLSMALKNAKFLTKRGSKGHFRYVQKYPYWEKKDDKK